jgi:hypothetical protein
MIASLLLVIWVIVLLASKCKLKRQLSANIEDLVTRDFSLLFFLFFTFFDEKNRFSKGSSMENPSSRVKSPSGFLEFDIQSPISPVRHASGDEEGRCAPWRVEKEYGMHYSNLCFRVFSYLPFRPDFPFFFSSSLVSLYFSFRESAFLDCRSTACRSGHLQLSNLFLRSSLVSLSLFPFFVFLDLSASLEGSPGLPLYRLNCRSSANDRDECFLPLLCPVIVAL